MMEDFRTNPPRSIGGSPVVAFCDYEKRVCTDLKTGAKSQIDLPESNVLQFVTEDSTIVSVRPSGTEPKIKFYFGVRGELPCVDELAAVEKKLDEKIEAIKKELKLI